VNLRQVGDTSETWPPEPLDGMQATSSSIPAHEQLRPARARTARIYHSRAQIEADRAKERGLNLT
jgi:hypothetical protein